MGIIRQERVYPLPNGELGEGFPYGAFGPEPDQILPWVNDTTPYMEMELGTVQDTILGTAGIHPHHQHVNSFQLIELDTIQSYDRMSQATKDWFQDGDWHDLFQWPLGFWFGPNHIPIGPPCCCSDDFNDRDGSDSIPDGFVDPICLPIQPPACVNGNPYRSPPSPLHPFDSPEEFSCGKSPGPPTVAKIRFPVNQFGGRLVFHCHRLNHEDLGMIGFYKVNGEEGTLWDGAQDVNPQCLLPKLEGKGKNTIVV